MSLLRNLLGQRVLTPRALSPLYRAQLALRLPRLARLSLRLLRDPRAPRAGKAATLGAIALLLSPINLPGWAPVIGQAADALVIATILDMYIRSAPRHLVQEHVAALGLQGRIAGY